jgi:hypothetical protein
MGSSRDEQGENNRPWPRHVSASSSCVRTVPFVRTWQPVYWSHEYERRGMCGVPLSVPLHSNTISRSVSLMKLAFHSFPRLKRLNPPSDFLGMRESFSVVAKPLPDPLSLVPVGIASGLPLIFLLGKRLSRNNWSATVRSVMCSARTLIWSCSCLYFVGCSRFVNKHRWRKEGADVLQA